MADLRFDRAAIPLLAIAFLFSLSTMAQGIMPPRPGQTLPDSIVEKLESSPTAFQFQNAYLDAARRARENSRAFLAGRLTAEEAKKAGGTTLAGLRPIPVVPVLFRDSPKNPYDIRKLQTELFDGPWSTGTLTEYYREISYGHLDVTGSVLPRVKLPKDGSHYIGADYTDSNGVHHCHGVCDSSNMGALIETALSESDRSVDFGAYDSDGPDGVANSKDDDGYVDVVVFVQPGRGGECEKSTEIWSHQYNLNFLQQKEFQTKDKRPNGEFVKVRDYVVVPAYACDGTTMIEIGVFAHEIGHAFGLPDLYDTSSEPQWQGVGQWDLMGFGSWGGDWNSPHRPTHMSAWTKSQVGWLEPVKVQRNRKQVNLLPVEYSPHAFQQSLPAKKRYISEFRAKKGFDQDLPAEGLLVWKVDDSVVEPGLRSNRVNANRDAPGMMLVEADGSECLRKKYEEGDPPCGEGIPFPGTNRKWRNFDGTTKPAMEGDLAICDIGDPGNTQLVSLHTTTKRCSAGKSPTAPAAKAAEIPLPELQRNAKGFVDDTIAVVGTLKNAGTNYFNDMKLELQDESGHRIPVNFGQVAEVAPSKPGTMQTAPKTLSSLLDQKVTVTGTVGRSAAGYQINVLSAEVAK